jgi:hypothetical protein
LYAVTFSAIANYGLLTRQRSLALPAFFVLLAVEPAAARPEERRPDRGRDEIVPTGRAIPSRGG